MINDFWFKVFVLVYFCIIGFGIGLDMQYYAKHFGGGKHGRKGKF